MPKLTKRANRYGLMDRQTDGPTLIIEKKEKENYAFKNINLLPSKPFI